MLIHPQINPVALQLGPLAVHWYGLTYLAAFGLFMFLGFRRLKHEPFASITGTGAWSRKDVEDLLFMGVMGLFWVGVSAIACFTSQPITCPIRLKYLQFGKVV